MLRLLHLVLLATTVQHSPVTGSYFWHITDAHVDPYYWSDEESNSCNEMLDKRGLYGDYECDSPYELLRSAVKAISDNGREPEFIIYSGDTPAHMKDFADFSQSVIKDFLENVTDLFNRSFPDVRFVMALGNHDYYPENQLPGNENAIYAAAVDMWARWFDYDRESLDSFRKGAYYTQLVKPDGKTRLVVLNTNLYAANNHATEGMEDPGEQYTWLEAVMSAARQNGEKVHLVMHIPVGVMPVSSTPRWLRADDNVKLVHIVKRYSDIIIGIYAGHEHFDTFRLIYSDGKPVSAVFVAPSITPWRARLSNGTRGMAHNPGIRKITYDAENGYVEDIEQYFLDLPKANEDASLQWRRLYTLRGLYAGVDNLTAHSLHQLVDDFKEYGSEDFHVYYDFYSTAARHSSNLPCSCVCKFTHICSMQSIDYNDFEMCYKNIMCKGSTTVFSVVLTVCALIFNKIST